MPNARITYTRASRPRASAGSAAVALRRRRVLFYAMDPCSAIRAEGDRRPVVVLSTAHPAKFPEAVQRAIGREPEAPARLAQSTLELLLPFTLEALIPASLARLSLVPGE